MIASSFNNRGTKDMKYNVLMTLGLTAIALSSNIVLAEGFKDRELMHQKHMEALELTDAQKAKFIELRKAQQESRKEIRAKNRELMADFLNAPSFDEEKAKQLIHQKREQRELNRLKMRYEMNKVLTEEQRAKMDSFRAERQNKKNWNKDKQNHKRENRKEFKKDN